MKLSIPSCYEIYRKILFRTREQAWFKQPGRIEIGTLADELPLARFHMFHSSRNLPANTQHDSTCNDGLPSHPTSDNSSIPRDWNEQGRASQEHR